MSVSEISSLMGLLSVTAFVGYWVLWSHRDDVPMAGSVAKAGAVAPLAVIAGLSGLWLIALGLFLGALGDFALSRRGQPAFLAGMAAFALGHLAFAVAFWAAVDAGGLEAWRIVALLGLLVLLLSTEAWLAPRTGALRWPVRGYVAMIGVMAAVTVFLQAGAGVIWCGVALFVVSDLLLALRLFVVTDVTRQKALSLVLWPASALGQALILLGSLAYWGV